MHKETILTDLVADEKFKDKTKVIFSLIEHETIMTISTDTEVTKNLCRNSISLGQ